MRSGKGHSKRSTRGKKMSLPVEKSTGQQNTDQSATYKITPLSIILTPLRLEDKQQTENLIEKRELQLHVNQEHCTDNTHEQEQMQNLRENETFVSSEDVQKFQCKNNEDDHQIPSGYDTQDVSLTEEGHISSDVFDSPQEPNPFSPSGSEYQPSLHTSSPDTPTYFSRQCADRNRRQYSVVRRLNFDELRTVDKTISKYRLSFDSDSDSKSDLESSLHKAVFSQTEECDDGLSAESSYHSQSISNVHLTTDLEFHGLLRSHEVNSIETITSNIAPDRHESETPSVCENRGSSVSKNSEILQPGVSHEENTVETVEANVTPELNENEAFASSESGSGFNATRNATTPEPGTSKTYYTSHVSIKNNSEVTLSVKDVLHQGRYRFHLFILGNCKDGFIEPVQVDVTHFCETPSSGGIVALLTRAKNSNRVDCQVNVCIPPDSKLHGTETFSEHASLFITPLSAPAAATYCQRKDSSPLFAPLNYENLKSHTNYCLFCKQMKTQIARHFKVAHKNEPEVQSILRLQRNSPEYVQALKNLRVKSNSVYNSKCEPSKRLPIRNPANKEDVSKFVQCFNCEQFLAPRGFNRHEKKCTGRPPNREQVLRAAKKSMQIREAVVKQGRERVDLCLEKFLSEFDDDDKADIIRNDQCLRWYARDKAFQNRNVQHHYPYHRTQLRRGATILLKAQSLNPDLKSFGDLLNAKNQNLLVESIILCCQIDAETGDIKTPSVIPHFKVFIEHCVEAEIRARLENGEKLNSERMQELNAFKQLHAMNFKSWLGSDSRRAYVRKLALKVRELPSTKDVCNFTHYLRSIAEECYKYLLEHSFDEKFPYDKWLLLGKAVQCQWVMFNRRRCGEMSRILLSQYETHTQIDPSFLQGLDEQQQRFCHHFQRFLVVAKKLRVLPVLTTDTQIKHMDLFISLRERAGISSDNPYLFCAQTKSGWIHCGQSLLTLAKKSGIRKPYLMGTTNIRKQVATLAQHLKMDYNEMVQLADFMGHDLKVHQQNYRQHEAVMQATKIAKFLMATQSENMSQYRSKNIDDIEINLDSAPIVLDDFLMEDDVEDENEIDGETEQDNEPPIEHNQSATDPVNDNQQPISPVEHSTTVDLESTSEVNIVHSSTSKTANEFSGSSSQKRLKKKRQKPRFPTTPELLVKLNGGDSRSKRVRKQYTKQQKQFLYQHMKPFFEQRKQPSMSFCKRLALKYPEELGHRNKECVYSFAQYRLKKMSGTNK